MLDIQTITGRDKTLKVLQQLQLEGLKEIDRICRKHNIKYSLGGGTCLGQIRHGGIIPWDDDIDVDMTTENYNKFMQVALKEIDENKFFLRCRQTDKQYLRTCSRLELNFTSIATRKWDKKKMRVGVFIDIFKWSYLPNNRFLRRIVASSLFYIRCIENYKMFHIYARKANPKLKNLIIFLSKIIPNKFIFYIEDRLTECCGKKKTNWIMDDAIINGNHGGYLSTGIDEYEDVEFEGIKVMNKKNAHNFMKTIYGENYNQWLKPIDRISHHQWTHLNFGVYETRYDLPEDYTKYISIKYNQEKLEHMQKISFEILDEVDKICKKNNLKYFVTDINAYIKCHEVDEFGKIWRKPLKIAMPRRDYDTFKEISQKKLGKKYFYQSTETDKEYKYSYARIRLNLTSIREAKTPKFIEEKYNNGFFIEIIPLENTANEYKEREKHKKKIKRLNHFVLLKWKKNNFRVFLKGNIKTKIKLIMLLPFSVDKLMKKLDKERKKYNNIDTNYYIDGSGYQLNGVVIQKAILGNGRHLEYNGHNYNFPLNTQKYIETMDNIRTKKAKYNRVKQLKYIKDNFTESYLSRATNISTKEIKRIQKRYPACYLNYFDMPEYQLSVLRYDEKEDRYLSNDEILNKL